MSDLTERLRASFIYDQQHYAADPLLAEAADRLEALEGFLRLIRHNLSRNDDTASSNLLARIDTLLGEQ